MTGAQTNSAARQVGVLSGRRLPDSLRQAPRVPGRSALISAYGQDMALFNTRAKRVSVGLALVVALTLPWLLKDDVLQLGALACAASIGAIGLNLVTGYAGQVSLGHAFFIGVGAYTAAVLSGRPGGLTLGFGITNILVWLLAAGFVAALFGVLVAPLAVRLRGLYLAIVTLGLVFVGEHVYREWTQLTGGVDIGRPAPVPEFFGYQLDVPDAFLTKDQKLYLLCLLLLVVFALLARNLVRSKVGRAFAAVRDRDIAAEVMGIDLTRYKLLAFTVSSFYGGCAGALYYTVYGYLEPTLFGILLSVQYIAMVLIGGAGTISGSIMGAIFITFLPRLTQELPGFLPFLSTDATDSPSIFQAETVLYGALIIIFLLFEPRGLYGIWVRIRTYWKSWPFSHT